ncbi:MAG: hypothetical protein H6835_17850 [Planctomycetes bacterium]|nr:hypothetical protein [Planctomycetota bacterium]
MLAQEPVKARVGELAIGLAIDCDTDQGEVSQLLHEKMPDAGTLPFVALLTSEGEWIDGYSGYRDATQFLVFLEDAASSPLLDAKPDVQKKLQKLVVSAKAGAAKGSWGQVAKDVRAAAAMPGRCPERKELMELGKQADEWLQAKFATVITTAQGDGDLSEARKLLQEVQKVFSGLPEAKLAATGIEALARVGFVRKVEARGNAKATLRQDEAAKYKDTPWTALFEAPKAPDAQPAGEKHEGDGK